MATIKLGELLVKAKVLQDSQLKSALAEQQRSGGRLGETLVRMTLITEDLLVKALSRQLGIPSVNVDSLQFLPEHLKARLPGPLASELLALPIQLRDDGKTLVVAMAEPQNLQQVELIRARARCKISPQVAGASAIARAIARFYESGEELPKEEEAFKMVDAQGNTVVKSVPPPQQPAAPWSAQEHSAPPDPVELLRTVEEAQRKEVCALKAMIEILIEKGVFSKEEYLSKVKR